MATSARVRGTVEHRGGIAFFTEGGPSLKFSKFVLEIGKNKTKLFAKSGGAEVRFLDVDLSDATIGGSLGTDLRIRKARATLAKQGASVMSEVFGFPFRKGSRSGP